MIKKYFWWIVLAFVVLLVWRSIATAQPKNDPFGATPGNNPSGATGQITYRQINCTNTTVLGLGDVCDMVAKIQAAYNTKQPNANQRLQVDGYFGPATELVVLKVTGTKRSSYMNFFSKLNNIFYVGN